MDLTSLSAAEFKNIIELLEKKETLQARVAKLDAQLAAYAGGDSNLATKPARRKPDPVRKAKSARTKRARRSATTDVIATDAAQPPETRGQEESAMNTGPNRCRFCGGRPIPGSDVCFSCDDSR